MLEGIYWPTFLDEALGSLGSGGDGIKVVAGGTDLVVQMRKGILWPKRLLGLSKLKDQRLRSIHYHEGAVHIGPLVTHNELAHHPDIGEKLPLLADAARTVGSQQVRNVGTVGGNIGNSSPAADVATALLALGASVSLESRSQSRTSDLHAFFVGPGKNIMDTGELLTGIQVPAPRPHHGHCYIKVGKRQVMAIAVLSVACWLVLGRRGEIEDCGIALSSVSPWPLKAIRCESFLRGRFPTEENLMRAGTISAMEASPISDVRGTASYRRHLVQTLVPEAIRKAFQTIKERGMASES